MYMRYLLFLSILPAYLLGKYVYNHDKVEKEPKNLLTKLFIFGIISTVITIVVSIILDIIFPYFAQESVNLYDIIIHNFIGVALIEEGIKWIMLKIGSWNDKNFDYQYDGMIYAVFVSLGFATVENILYVLVNGFVTGILRAIVSVPGHAFFGVFMGYYYGLAKKAQLKGNNSAVPGYLFLSLLIPVILHGTFDASLSVTSILKDDTSIVMVLGFYIIFVIFLYIISFRKIKQLADIKTNIYDVMTREIPVMSNNQGTVPVANVPINNVRNVYCTQCGKLVFGKFCANCGARTVIE